MIGFANRSSAGLRGTARLGAVPWPMSGVMDHPSLGRVKYSIKEVSDDPDQQVAETIGLMRQYANEDAGNLGLQADVAAAWQSDDAIGDTFNYLRRNGARGMQFVPDETNGAPFESAVHGFTDFDVQQPGGWRPVVETLIRPADQCLLPNPQGDCDDFAQYGAAHLMARGVPCSYATVGVEPQDPSVYSHVYLVAYPKDGPYGGMRVPLDLSHGPQVGWECPNPWGKFQEWPLAGGLGLVGWGLLIGGGLLAWRAMRRVA